MKQCRVDAFVVGPKKREFFGCYEWICIRCVSEGKRRRYFQLDYRSFWSMVDDNFCIVDMHKGNFADFFGAQSQGTNIFFFFCGTEPSPQSKRRTRGHRRLIQASSFDTKQTFNTTQKPFKSSDFCTNVFLFQGCPSPPQKKKTHSPFPLEENVGVFPSKLSLFCLDAQKTNPFGFGKIWVFFHQRISPHPNESWEVDGGVTVRTAALAGMAGANEVVAGSAIFGASNVRRSIRQGTGWVGGGDGFGGLLEKTIRD